MIGFGSNISQPSRIFKYFNSFTYADGSDQVREKNAVSHDRLVSWRTRRPRQVGLLCGLRGLSLAKSSWEPLAQRGAPRGGPSLLPGSQSGVKLGAAVGDEGEVKRSGLL